MAVNLPEANSIAPLMMILSMKKAVTTVSPVNGTIFRCKENNVWKKWTYGMQ